MNQGVWDIPSLLVCRSSLTAFGVAPPRAADLTSRIEVRRNASKYDHPLNVFLVSTILFYINVFSFVEWEFTEAQGRDNAMHIIQNKIISLAKKFGTNDKYFPLGKCLNT